MVENGFHPYRNPHTYSYDWRNKGFEGDAGYPEQQKPDQEDEMPERYAYVGLPSCLRQSRQYLFQVSTYLLLSGMS